MFSEVGVDVGDNEGYCFAQARDYLAQGLDGGNEQGLQQRLREGALFLGEPASGGHGALDIKAVGLADIEHGTSIIADGQAVMGIDLGIKVPAVAHISGKGTRFFGNGRYQRHMRRRFYSRRKKLQKAKKTRAVKKDKGREARWMKDINHKISRQIVNHAHEQGVGTIKVESLAGIRKGTTRTSRGAKARKNNRMKNSWSFSQLTLFISYKAARLGIKVEQVDPAYTSQECPACSARNKAQDRTYVTLCSRGKYLLS